MSAETIRLIRDGEKRGRGYGGGRRGRLLYLSLHCYHQDDSCIKMGSDESHFNVSLIVRDKVTRQTGPRSAVVSASDCGSEGLGFESHQSHVGFFGPGRLQPRAGSAMGPVGRLEPHSRASSA